jgi:guanine deaminase
MSNQTSIQSSIQSSNPSIAIRGTFLDFIGDPFYQPESASVRYITDGLMVVENGIIRAFGDYDTVRAHMHAHMGEAIAEWAIVTYPGHLIMPGLIDLHLHLPQTEMIAAYGEQLLTWLETYTFPTERKFQDKAYGTKVAQIFIDQLLRNGTTTAMVFATVHPESVAAFFAVAQQQQLRMIAGKVMMDRHAPEYLTDTAASSYAESKALIETWHGRDRLRYAITPRFAPTSTEAQLALAGTLLQEYPDVYLHTHLSENIDEVAWVKALFPNCTSYLDVYDRFGLVGNRSIFAHCVQLDDADFQRLAAAGSAIAFCPTSNLFLGSGLFRLEQATATNAPIKFGFGTDIGAGTSFSLFQTASAAYTVAQLRQQKLSPFQALFLATLGGARALSLDDKIGNFDPGKEADFIIVDPRSTPLMAFRNADTTPADLTALADRVFSLLIMGDDRAIRATYILGALAYDRDGRQS